MSLSSELRQTTHLRLDALEHAATVVHTLAVGGLSQAQLAGAQTLLEVTASDAAVTVIKCFVGLCRM